jgi:hypothetical protein
MVSFLPVEISDALINNPLTMNFYKRMEESTYCDYKSEVERLYTILKDKFDIKDQAAYLTYFFNKVDTISRFDRFRELINTTIDYLKNIRPRESGFYYIYALELPEECQDEVFYILNQINAEVHMLMQDACGRPLFFMMNKDKLKEHIDNQFSMFRDSKILNKQVQIKELINAAIDDAIKYVNICIARAKKDETYCNECDRVYCIKRDKKSTNN